MTDGSNTAGGAKRPLLNVFTCADRKYQDFSLLFALSNLHHIDDSIVEIGLEDPETFASENERALSLLDETFGRGRVLLRSARFQINGRRVRPGTVRFIETPSPAEYVYISDIDIITLDPALPDVHIAFMKRRNLPYSNSVRATDRSRMSGLHFARYDDWYPLPAVADVIDQMSDERVLRIICERKGFPVQEDEWFRPVHGIHISPNRSPYGSTRNGTRIPGWSIEPHITAFRRFAGSPVMGAMWPLFSERIKCYLEDIELICDAPTPVSRREVGESLSLKYQRKELTEARDRLLRRKQYSEASALELEYLARHPNDAAVHQKAAQTFRQLGDLTSAIVHQERVVKLDSSNGNARLVLTKLLEQVRRRKGRAVRGNGCCRT